MGLGDYLPEEEKERLREEYRRSKEKAAAQEKVVDVNRKREPKEYHEAQRETYKGIARREALSKKPPSALAEAFKLGETMEPDKAAAWRQKMLRAGYGVHEAMSGDVQYGGDVDKAMRTPGAKRDIIGDKVVVLDPKSRVIAVSQDYPSVAEHVGAEGSTNLGVISNLLTRPLAAAATAATHAATPDRPDDDVLGDVGRALAGTGKSVAYGGKVTQGTAPIGDYYFAKAREALKTNPDATFGDIVDWVPLTDDMKSRRLADMQQEDYNLFGEAIGLGVDPLNFIPGKAFTAPAKAAMRAVRRAKPFAAAKAVIGAPKHADEFELGLEQAGVQGAARVGAELAETPSIAAARAAEEARDVERVIAKHKPNLTPKQAEELADVIEREAVHATPDEVVAGVASLDEQALPLASRNAVAAARQLSADAEAMANLRMTVDDLDIAIARAPDDVAKKAAREGWEKARARAGEVVRRGYSIAREAGRPDLLVRNLPELAAKHGDEMANAAADISSVLNREREALQAAGNLPATTTFSRNYLPHIAKGAETFSPFKRRTLVASDELRDLRKAVLDDVAEGGGAELGDEVVDAFRRGDTAQMLKHRDAVRTWYDRLAPGDDAATFDAALGARTGEEAERNVFTLMSKYADAARDAKSRSYVGQRIAGMTDDAGVPIAQTVNEFLGARGLDIPRSEAKVGGLHRGDDLGYRPTTDMMRALGTTHGVVTGDAARKMPLLAGKVVPRYVLDEIAHMSASMTPGVLEKASAQFAKVHRYWAPLVLSTPGFHTRNAAYTMFQMAYAIGPEKLANPRRWQQAHRLAALAEAGEFAAGASKAGRNADVIQASRHFGIVEAGRTSDIASWQKSTVPAKGEHGSALLSMVNPASERFLPFRAARQVSRTLGRLPSGVGGSTKPASMENVQRMYVFLHELENGKSALEASTTVKKYLFDYTGAKLSDAEKTIRRVLPFYQWLRFSTQQMLEIMLTQPRAFAQTQRLFRMLDASSEEDPTNPRFEPEYMARRGATRVPQPITDLLARLGIGEGQDLRMMLERPGVQLDQDPDALAEQMGPAYTALLETVLTNTALGTGGKYTFGGGQVSPSMAADPDPNALERFFNLNSEDALKYVASKLGPVNMALAPLQGSAARRPGTEETDRDALRAIAMLLGPKIGAFRSEEEALRLAREGQKITRDITAAQKAKAKQKPSALAEAWLEARTK